MSAYHVHNVLPAMCIADPVTVGTATFCTSAHLSQYLIDSPEDARSIALMASNYRPAYGHGVGRIGLTLVPAAYQAALERDGIRPSSFTASGAPHCDCPRIDEIAPLLFRECLLERLRQLGVLARPRNRSGAFLSGESP